MQLGTSSSCALPDLAVRYWLAVCATILYITVGYYKLHGGGMAWFGTGRQQTALAYGTAVCGQVDRAHARRGRQPLRGGQKHLASERASEPTVARSVGARESSARV